MVEHIDGVYPCSLYTYSLKIMKVRISLETILDFVRMSCFFSQRLQDKINGKAEAMPGKPDL